MKFYVDLLQRKIEIDIQNGSIYYKIKKYLEIGMKNLMWCIVLHRWKITLLIKMQIFIVCNNLRLLIYGLLFVTHCHAGRIFGKFYFSLFSLYFIDFLSRRMIIHWCILVISVTKKKQQQNKTNNNKFTVKLIYGFMFC